MAMTMGQIIRRLRKERNLTQEELAERLGITPQAVSRWENETGMPDISQVVPLANVFGVSIEGMLNIMTRLGQAYALVDNFGDAAETLETALALIDCMFAKDAIKPPIHYRETGDLYMLLAEISLKAGDRETALRYLETMVDYDTGMYERVDETTVSRSPLLRARAHEFYIRRVR